MAGDTTRPPIIFSPRRHQRGQSSPVTTRLHFGFLLALLAGVSCMTGCKHLPATATAPGALNFIESAHGGIIRGDRSRRAIALSFTGHEFAEGGETILNELQKHRGKGSFFLTGEFLTNPALEPLVRRMASEGHYFSVHSDQHLLYCSWERDRKTLVTRAQFQSDLKKNQQRFQRLKLAAAPGHYFIPPYEHYNSQIVAWAAARHFTVINYTPGTRSPADYTGEADQNFVSSQTIFDSIVKREREDPHGLNGFILLLHIGSGPGRADKFHSRIGELLDYLASTGYEFVRVDELLESKSKP